MFKIKLVAIIAISGLIFACSSTAKIDKEIEESDMNTLHQKAQENLDKKNFADAARYLEALDARTDSEELSEQLELSLIDAYKQDNEPELALATIDRFIQLHRSSSKLDYVLYLRGLINSEISIGFLNSLFNEDQSERDVEALIVAHDDFSLLVNNFPNSQYAPDALERMAKIKNDLAKKEYSIVQFYSARDAHVAVVKRVEKMRLEYPTAEYTYKALPYAKHAYEQLNLIDNAEYISQLMSQK